MSHFSGCLFSVFVAVAFFADCSSLQNRILSSVSKPGSPPSSKSTRDRDDSKKDGSTLTLDVATTSMNDGIVEFRSAEATYNVPSKSLSKETLRLFRKSLTAKRIVQVKLKAQDVNSFPNTLGVRPDCTELPLSYAGLEMLAKSPNVNSIEDFVKSIPKGTLQTFTFVHKSRSPQAEDASKDFPRVIRMSRDGKVFLAYTCDPSKPHYNTAEIIHFSDRKKGYQFAQLDFRKPASPGGGRVERNPAICLNCHAPDVAHPDPRPNWERYFTWDGVYGKDDDNIGSLTPKELTDFEKFKKKQAKNPCYSELPWPTQNKNGEIPPAYKDYPYSTAVKNSNYHLRPNLKLTEISSHLLGQRLARKFWTVPRFRELRLLVAMDQLGCEMPKPIDDLISEILPKYKAPGEKTKKYRYDYAEVPGASAQEIDDFLRALDPRTDEGGSRRLYAIGEAFSFKEADWTMRFNEPKDPMYTTGLSRDLSSQVPADISVMRLTLSQLMVMIDQEYPDLKLGEYFTLGRGESANFGAQFSCIDDLGGELFLKQEYERPRAPLCKMMWTEHLADVKFAQKNPEEQPEKRFEQYPQHDPDLPDPEAPVGPQFKVVPKLAARGKTVVSQVCMKCHVPNGTKEKLPKELQFFKDEKALAVHFKKESGFLETVLDRINDEDDPMPPSGALHKEDREALKNYLVKMSR